MAVGFESYTSDGVLQFSTASGQKSLIAGGAFYSGSPYNGTSVSPGSAYWVNLGRGADACILHHYSLGYRLSSLSGGATYRVATDRGTNLVSGYLDVFGEDGTLNWSAESMGRIPDIAGVMAISASNAVYGGGGAVLPDDYWVCMSCALVVETNVAYVGVRLKRDGSGRYYLQGEWSGFTPQALQEGLAPTIYIPYARIRG